MPDSFVDAPLDTKPPDPFVDAPLDARLTAFEAASSAGQDKYAQALNTPKFQESIERGPSFPNLSNMPYNWFGDKGGGLFDKPPSGGFEEVGSYVPVVGPAVSALGAGVDWALGKAQAGLHGVGTGVHNAIAAVREQPQDFIGVDPNAQGWEGFKQYASAPFRAAVGSIAPGTPGSQLKQLGMTPLEEAPPALSYDAKGDLSVDWSRALGNVGRGAAETAIAFGEDPLSYLHPGLPGAKARVAARSENVLARAAGEFQPAVDTSYLARTGERVPFDTYGLPTEQAAKQWLTPGAASKLERGDLGFQVRVPFTEMGVDVRLPQALMPLARGIDFIDAKMPLIGESGLFRTPSARLALQSLGNTRNAHAAAVTSKFLVENIVPIHRRLREAGATDEQIATVGNMLEVTDPSSPQLQLRLPPEAESSAAIQKFNEGLGEKPLRIQKELAELKGVSDPALEQARIEGTQHFADVKFHDAMSDLEQMSTWEPQLRAASVQALDDLRQVPEKVRLMAEAEGVHITPINAEIRAKLAPLVKELSEIDRQLGADNVRQPMLREGAEPKALTGPLMDAKLKAKLQERRAELMAELPDVVRNFNAVPTYRPGVVGPQGRTLLNTPNPNVRGTRIGLGSVEGTERSAVHGAERGDQTIPGVKFSVKEHESEIAKGGTGTQATSGRTLEELAGSTWWPKFLTPKGLQEARKLAAETGEHGGFFEPNVFEAYRRQLQRPLYTDIRDAQLDKAILNTFDNQPIGALVAAKRVARHGVTDAAQLLESVIRRPGGPELEQIFNEAGGKAGLEAVEQLIRDGKRAPTPQEMRAAFDAAGGGKAVQAVMDASGRSGKAGLVQADWQHVGNVSFTRNADLADLQKVFEQYGGHGKVEGLFKDSVAQGLREGTVPLEDAFKWGANPYERAPVTLDGKGVYLHEGVANGLAAFKKLGNDPIQLLRGLGQAAPYYLYMLTAWKKLQTYAGAQFIAYNIRNQTGDLMRMMMADGVDANPIRGLSEWKRLYNDMLHYERTGDVRALTGSYDLGNGVNLTGDELGNHLAEGGVLNRGQILGDVRATEAQPLRGVPGAGLADTLREQWQRQALDRQAARENANRAYMFVQRLRRGDTPFEAAFRTSEALFDYSRLSPGANMLRQTGIAPFIAWQSKNIPFVFNWAFENPGYFMAVLRGMDIVENGGLPESQLPEYMRDKHNIVIQRRRNEKGQMEAVVVTNSGIMPLTDLSELYTSIRRNGGFNYFQQQAGPILGSFALAMKMADEDAGTHSAGENVDRLAQQVGGRPYQIGSKMRNLGKTDPRTGEVTGAGEIPNQTLNPIKQQVINLTQAGIISVKGAEKNLKGSLYNASHAQQALSGAIAEARAAGQALNTQQAITGDERFLARYRADVAKAQAKVQRMRGEWTRTLKDAQEVRKQFESLKLAN